MSTLIGVNEVMEICSIKEAKAYKIMRILNAEMEEKGYLTVRGKINKNYLIERIGERKVLEEAGTSTSTKE